MTIQDLKDNGLIIFQVITGSQAYGTAEPTSDIDRKGVFVLPIDMLLSDNYIAQVSDETNDNTYFEIAKFIEMVGNNNPTAIELLNAPEDTIEIKSELMNELLMNKDSFLSKMCKNSFGEYARTQIAKARGLNKKIVNPIAKEKKTPLDFCFVIDGYKTYSLKRYLENNGLNQKFAGIVKVPNTEGVFAMFYDEFSHACFDERIDKEQREISKSAFKNSFKGYKGIIKEAEDGELVSNEIRFSSVPKNQDPRCLFSYNKNGYTIYCKDYKEYWDWVAKRNPVRYNTNMKHKKGYDGKNMAHCYRLLETCAEIGEGKGVIVRRPNRDKLLDIKHGVYDYDELIRDAEDKINYISTVYETSNLPEKTDKSVLKDILVRIRKAYYNI